VVRYSDGVWIGAVPRAGWFAYVIDEADLYVFDGTAWGSFRRTLTAIQSVSRLGINTGADATNRLAVKSDAALLTWDDATPGSGDMRIAVNKQAASRDAGLILQTGYSARALLGLLGSDDFSLKVSPDGSTFRTALTASAAKGGIDFASTETVLASAATTDLGGAGTRRVLVTGTARITRFGSGADRERLLRFAGAATLVHDPEQLVLPTHTDIVTAADDTCLATSDGAGRWRVRQYQRADGTPLIFASTNKVYGDLADLDYALHGDAYAPVDAAVRDHGVGEDRPLDFHTPYGVSKGAADQYVLDYARSFGVPTAVLRMSCIYGQRQMGTEDQGWVAHFLIRALEGRPITLYGDGLQVRDILDVSNAVDAYVRAWQRIDAVKGRAFNLGGGPANAVSLRQLLAHIEKLVDRPVDVTYSDWRAGDQRYFVADTRAAEAALGLEPKVDWRDGVATLARWLAAERRLNLPVDDRRVAS